MIGQVISWNENTKETRMYIEKEATSMKLIKDSLSRAGVTQIQVCTFPHNDRKAPQWAHRSVTEHGAREGSRIVTLGNLKVKVPVAPMPSAGEPSATAPKKTTSDQSGDTEMGEGQAETLVSTNATLAQATAAATSTNATLAQATAAATSTNVTLAQAAATDAEIIARKDAEITRLNALTFSLRGQMGAAHRKDNIPVHASLELAQEKIAMEQEYREKTERLLNDERARVTRLEARLGQFEDLILQQATRALQ